MFESYLLFEAFTNGFSYNTLNIISLASIICGVLVIISKNPVVSVLFLIGLFLSIAGYLMMLGLNFIGLSYLLVYVGAVSILFLFILMLINVRVSELITDNNNSFFLAVVIGIIFNLALHRVLPSNSFFGSLFQNMGSLFATPAFKGEHEKDMTVLQNNDVSLNTLDTFTSLQKMYDNNLSHAAFMTTKDNISSVYSQIWDSMIAETSHITTIGNVIYTVYPLWLILTSIILLLAMVGAIVITIKQ